ncbi:MAG: NapC/NirT family cytochrome c, partial [Pseudolabrys sp.]
MARIWTFATTPTSRFSLATLLIVGGIGGLLFWGGFNWAMEVANTESFCISCHEMRDNAYKELQQTIHYKNRSGVRA